MKSKRLLMPIAILLMSAVLAIYVVMGLNYLDQQGVQTTLIGQIQQLTPAQENSKSSAKNNATVEELERRLEAALARVEEGRVPLNVGLFSTDILDNILEIANQSHFNTYSVRALSTYQEQVGDDVYTVLGFNVLAEGNPSDITAFIGQLEDGEMKTLRVKNVNLTQSSEFWSVGLDIAIFTNPSRMIAANLEETNG